MYWSRTFTKTFNCKECDAIAGTKKKHGCKRPVPESEYLWKTDECFVCWGQKIKCKSCGGSGAIRVRRCPRALARKGNALLPFFIDWIESSRTMWPNGGARLQQPVKLAEAFDLMASMWNRYKAEAINAG